MEESSESDYESTATSRLFTGRIPYPTNAGDYKILDQLSNGTTAVVHRAECLPKKTFVAIKIINLDITEKKLDINHIVAASSKLPDHDCILKPHCHFIDDKNKLWVVMPYMVGGSVMSIMSTVPGSMNPDIIASILHRVLGAITAMHAIGLSHMGIKPGNILLSETGDVRLSDYKVSTWNYEKELLCDVSSTLSSPSPVIAMPYWVAPETTSETLDAQLGFSRTADLFSFGLVALELLTGRPPIAVFPESQQMLRKIKKRFNFSDKWEKEREARKKRKKCPDELKEMINSCLQRDPAKRAGYVTLLCNSYCREQTILEDTLMVGLSNVRERFKPMAAAPPPPVRGSVSAESSMQRPIVGWEYDTQRMEFDPLFLAETALMADSKFLKNVSLGDVMSCVDIEKKLQTMRTVKELLEEQTAKLSSRLESIRNRRECEETAAAERPPAPAPERGE
ncbi:serine/threonine-protein kinase BLUS1-like [Andrographis paniculata]|uniref:serine/threonine-protein kinase BLUS1-like n=1 Tax=Andrographis paniculata TaxID=175694 RepID=UPI0021E95C5D|nr:serine/threonine-protein kinase BLUS1-like [Andrographis paniculata]